jgi:ribonuclease P/MRP protein subunit POP1
VLAFDVQDPRLHHPPRLVKPPNSPDAQMKLLELVATWPSDALNKRPGIFDRKARLAASSALPSQKAINRRKMLAPAGRYPDPTPNDPRIPVLFYTSPSNTKAKNQQSAWHILLPWKCVQPVWYSLMYTPLSTGQQPRFGGLDEQRQLALERGQPWFPGDFPGTKAGWEWEMQEAGRRKEDWRKRPKGKRVNWEAVDLGDGKKGEVGEGWACDWTRLIDGPPLPQPLPVEESEAMEVSKPQTDKAVAQSVTLIKLPNTDAKPLTVPAGLAQIPSSVAFGLLASSLRPFPASFPANSLLTVRISLQTRGLPTPCARIYRLPSDPKQRKAWIALQPSNRLTHKERHSFPPVVGRSRPAINGIDNVRIADHLKLQALAASLLNPPKAGEGAYSACPGEDDLIGFVTSGNYDLGAGKGCGIGSLLFGKVFEGFKANRDERRLCVVRNAGESVGRLGMWEVSQ